MKRWLVFCFSSLAFLASCGSKDSSGIPREKVKDVVREYAISVLYNTDLNKCKEIIGNYVYFKPFPNLENGYRLTKRQVEALCTELSAKPQKLHRLKDVEVSIAPQQGKTAVAILRYVRDDDQTIFQQSIILKDVEGKYYILW